MSDADFTPVDLPLKKLCSGKGRDVYELGEDLLMVCSDRISAFDVILPTPVPRKGEVLNLLSAYWFNYFQSVCPNHMITVDPDDIARRTGVDDPWLRGRAMICRRAEPIPIECVARRYLMGSLYKEYKSMGSNLYGLNLPDGLSAGDKLPEVVFTPATKASEGHDENISFEEMSTRCGAELAGRLKAISLQIFESAERHCLDRGLVLVDTKFEFGLIDGNVVWIDEALTPDSSRYWDPSELEPGVVPVGYDKQPVRDYLESVGWNKQPPAPHLPEPVVEDTARRYQTVFERITGKVLPSLA
jgi:phosphoribosylaminoimidazole-succinocarboxamide synthase